MKSLAASCMVPAANLGEVFIGIESPDEKVLETSRKHHNIKNPLLESLRTLKQNGMEVIGSFIIGLDGETPGAGERICAFIDQTDIPVTMLGVLQAVPHTSLWHRLEREGRLRQDVGDDLGTFSVLNYEPNRPEAEIMQEYLDAWDYLYEPSRYLARVYSYYLAMRPARRDPAMATGGPPRRDHVPHQGMTWRREITLIRSFFKILWWQGLRPPYRRQFWTQLLDMWRQNPTRCRQYFLTCVEGEDLFDMRKMVREKVTAIIKERQIEVLAAPSLRGVARRPR
jgi:radical SAM superfamily enzyme YgiQ (UPF0313 family)